MSSILTRKLLYETELPKGTEKKVQPQAQDERQTEEALKRSVGAGY